MQFDVSFAVFLLAGIANAIDLADRFLPRLQALNCEPSFLDLIRYKCFFLINFIFYFLLNLNSAAPALPFSLNLKHLKLLQPINIDACIHL